MREQQKNFKVQSSFVNCYIAVNFTVCCSFIPQIIAIFAIRCEFFSLVVIELKTFFSVVLMQAKMLYFFELSLTFFSLVSLQWRLYSTLAAVANSTFKILYISGIVLQLILAQPILGYNLNQPSNYYNVDLLLQIWIISNHIKLVIDGR